jgi:hypothetical protein
MHRSSAGGDAAGRPTSSTRPTLRPRAIDPEAQGPGGKTVRQVAAALGHELKRCGARHTARRLAKLAR